MTPRQKQRLSVLLCIILAVIVATLLALQAFKENIAYFLEPKDVAQGNYQVGSNYRIGGIVKTGSVERQTDGVSVAFVVTDCEYDIAVKYKGILPDLFREGQGIVVNGRMLVGGVMNASEVLAKHDENYIPPEAAEAMMKKQKAQCEQEPEYNAS